MSSSLVKYEGMGTRAFCIKGTAGHTKTWKQRRVRRGEEENAHSEEDHNTDLGKRKRVPEE